MGIDVADSFSHQAMVLDEMQRFLIGGHNTGGKRREKSEHLPPPGDLSAGNLTDDERVRCHIPAFQSVSEKRNRLVEMIDPDRGVDEDHEGRRLLGAFARGSLPPSRARRRALSLAINARNPS